MCKGNFHYARSAVIEAIHVLPQINTSAVVKKGNGTQRQVYDACTVATTDDKKEPLGPKLCQIVKNEPIALAIVELRWSESIRKAVSQLVNE